MSQYKMMEPKRDLYEDDVNMAVRNYASILVKRYHQLHSDRSPLALDNYETTGSRGWEP